MRFAPSLKVIHRFVDEGARVSVYDPQAMPEAKRIFAAQKLKKKKITFCKELFSVVKRSDCLCFLTEWEEFRRIDFRKVKRLMQYPLIADGRNMFERLKLEREGFHYIGVGR
jgi:UDPglucose 6-dehydrogenase